MDYRIDYFSASGTSANDCSFLAHRYDPAIGFKRLESESFVISLAANPIDPKKSRSLISLATTARLVRLWRSTKGQVFVADSFGEVLRGSPNVESGERVVWDKSILDGQLNGIWGLSSERVFAWGRRSGIPVVFVWDGTSWSNLRSPSFEVEAIHGQGPDTIWACGAGGRVAHWSGGAWQEQVLPTVERLISIHVVAEGELYATGVMGTVFEGSSFGWGAIGQIPGALQGDVQAVAKFAGELWVGASRLGLWQRIGKTNEYVCVKPNVPAVSFDTRGPEFLIGAETLIASTVDGKKFVGSGAGVIANSRGTRALGDF